ncbi:hypothetical protein FJQ98_12305 [Lysinibacillus agricola]|uniref:Uncharacterized protein n=2 Tax=Bacillaceae TaxID=186817 RepID=A0ABX7AY98_9BACI|nr:hypothetical protein FJQ98_12305 [Lysinibacillus agricola]
MLYGLMFFISLEMQLNYYRIVRLTGWEGQHFDILILLVHSVGFVVATIVLYKLTYKWIAHRRFIYWTTIFLLPYTALFIFIFACMFPITNQGDMPAPVQGLMLFAMLLFYLFYIGTLNMVCYCSKFDKVQIK